MFDFKNPDMVIEKLDELKARDIPYMIQTFEKNTGKGKGLMKVISVSTIGNLISAHMEGDNEKFLIFANFIADAYEEAGEVRCARIIRKRIDGTYKNDSTVTLD